jgi:glycerophosphoryl diester phosphodiesterase
MEHNIGRPSLRMSRAPLVIAHRGASAYRPEHTLAAYDLAIRLGADYIEPDLVMTKDGVLVARHENELSGTTDVAGRLEFAERETTKVVDGIKRHGWFTEDFTLDELKTLRAVERLPNLRPANTAQNGWYEVPTLQEVLDLLRRRSRQVGRSIGVYPETKTPRYFESIGHPLEDAVVEVLRGNRMADPAAAVLVQSFEPASLRRLRGEIDVGLVQLIGYRSEFDPFASPYGLAQIAEYADAVGPDKRRVAALTPEGELGEPTSLVDDAHVLGLEVHPYTFRDENAFLPTDLRRGVDPADWGDVSTEYDVYYRLGVDGVFADNPASALAARRAAVLSSKAA